MFQRILVLLLVSVFSTNLYSQEWIFFENNNNSKLGKVASTESTNYVSKTGGITFRVDDNQIIDDYVFFENIFIQHNRKFTFAVNFGLDEFTGQDYINSIRTLQSNGNELMDHTPEHRTNFFTTKFNASDYSNLSGVDHLIGDKVCLEYGPVDVSKAERNGTVNINGNTITSSTPIFNNFNEGTDIYLYFPSISKLVYIKNFINNKKVKVADVWEENINLGNHSNIQYYNLNSFNIHMTIDAIEVLGNESLKLANLYGMTRPYTWIQPGGHHPQFHPNEVQEALGNRLGYKAAAVYPNDAQQVYNEYDPVDDRKYAMQWADFVDDERTAKENKTIIAQGIAKNSMLIGHSHFVDAVGGFNAYATRVDSLLEWAVLHDIPVIKYTQMADSLYNYLPDPYENAFPLLNSDIDQNGIPDGYTNIAYPENLYGTWVIDNSTPGAGKNYFKITTDEPWANKITHILGLGGLEKGENEFSIWTQGATGDSISVEFAEPWPSNVKYRFKFPANTSQWQKYTIDDARPLGAETTLSFLETQSVMDVDFYCTDYVSGVVKIAGMSIAKKDSVPPVYNTTFNEKLVVLQNTNTNLKIAVQVKGNDLPPAKTLGSSTIDVTYDNTLLTFNNATNWKYGTSNGYARSATNNNGYVRIQSNGTTVNQNGGGSPAGYDLKTNYENWVVLNFIKDVNTEIINLNIKASSNKIGLFKNSNNEPKTDEIVNYNNTKINRTGVTIQPNQTYNTTFDEKIIVLSNDASNLKIAVQVKGNDLPPAKTLGSSTIDITYDKTLLTFSNVTNWAYGTSNGYTRSAINNNGYVRLISNGTTVNQNGGGNPSGYDIKTAYESWVEINFTKLINNQELILNIATSSNQLGLFKNSNNNPKTDEIENYDNTKINRFGITIQPPTGGGPDGTLDATFGNGGIVTTSLGTNDFCFDAALTSGGKILAAGYTNANGTKDFALVSYNSNGTLNNNFGSSGKVITPIGSSADEGRSITVASDGKIIVAGFAKMSGNKNRFAVVRYKANGTLDNTFSTDGKVTTALGSENDFGTSVTKDANNKIVVAGLTKSGSLYKVALVKYNLNGSLDNTFGTNGKVIINQGVTSITNQNVFPDVSIDNFERIVVRAGTDLLIRFNSNGTLDNSFGTGGIIHTTNSFGQAASVDMAIDLDGRIVLMGNGEGSPQEFGFYITRFAVDGNFDVDFGLSGITDVPWGYKLYMGKDITVDAQGRILTANIYEEEPSELYPKDFCIYRHVDGGWIDDDFDEDGIVETLISETNETAEFIGIDSNGKIVLAGTQESEIGTDFIVARYYGSTQSGEPGMNVVEKDYITNQNYPNPFNPSTVIRFMLPADNHVTLKVYNMIGQEVATLIDDYKSAGLYKATFDATDLPSGIYIYRLNAGSFTEVHKMLLLK